MEGRGEVKKSKGDEADEVEAGRRSTTMEFLRHSLPEVPPHTDLAPEGPSAFQDVASLAHQAGSIHKKYTDGDKDFLRRLEGMPDTRAAPEYSDPRENMPSQEHEDEQDDLWERFEDGQLVEEWDREAVEAFSSTGSPIKEYSFSNSFDSPGLEIDYRTVRPQAKQRSKLSFSTARLTREQSLDDTLNLSLLEIDYRAMLPQAVRRGETDMIVRCLFAASRAGDTAFISGLSQEMFTRILSPLEPANSIEKLALAHVDISMHAASMLGIQQMRFVADDQAYVLSTIFSMWRAAGQQVSLEQYKILLRSARDLGSHRLAVMLFAELHADGHQPDTECYNYWMASRVWNGVHNVNTRHKMRVTQHNLEERRKTNPWPEFANYRIGDGGLKEDVMSMFTTLLTRGLIADEETYRYVIMAAAREGDLTTVKNMLRKVWDIDVDGIMNGTDDSQLVPRAMEKDSPLYPTGGLLFAVAHAFTINNQVSVALRLIDFIAEQYNLEIDQDTWTALFQSTFVLSRRFWGNLRRTGSAAGKLPSASVLHLWTTMTGEPYNIKPTMSMYNHLIKNLFRRDMAITMVMKMEEGRQLYLDSISTATSLYRKLNAGVNRAAQDNAKGDRDRATLVRLRDDWELANLLRQRGRYWCARWLRLLLGQTATHVHQRWAEDLMLRVIPRMLWEWSAFVLTNNKLRFEVPGGQLEFRFRTEEEIDQVAEARYAMLLQQRETLNQVEKFVGDDWYRPKKVKMARRVKAKVEREQQTLHEDVERRAGDEGGGADAPAESAVGKIRKETE